MEQPNSQNAEAVLDGGPFPRALVTRWPKKLRDDYLELLGEDLQSLGPEEFRRMRRALGEAYLLSLNKAIESDPNLFDAWKAVAGDTPPPEPLEFR